MNTDRLVNNFKRAATKGHGYLELTCVTVVY